MKFFLLLLLFIPQLLFSQCDNSIMGKLEDMETIPYLLIDKGAVEVEPGKSFTLPIRTEKQYTKYKFIFILEGLLNPVYVSIITLNRKVLIEKKITNTDNSIDIIFKKTEKYFIIINTKVEEKSEDSSRCIGVVTLMRVSRRKYQRIKWKK